MPVFDQENCPVSHDQTLDLFDLRLACQPHCLWCNVAQPEPSDLLAVLKSRPSLTRFAEAFENTGVAGQLQPSNAYTVFAPIDKAVAGPLDAATVRNHVLADRVTFSNIAGENASYTTLNGNEIDIEATDRIIIGTGLMVESDISAANGVIHVIDRVQEPSGKAPARLIAPIRQ